MAAAVTLAVVLTHLSAVEVILAVVTLVERASEAAAANLAVHGLVLVPRLAEIDLPGADLVGRALRNSADRDVLLNSEDASAS